MNITDYTDNQTRIKRFNKLDKHCRAKRKDIHKAKIRSSEASWAKVMTLSLVLPVFIVSTMAITLENIVLGACAVILFLCMILFMYRAFVQTIGNGSSLEQNRRDLHRIQRIQQNY